MSLETKPGAAQGAKKTNYNLIEKLGSGTFGEVYLAANSTTGREVAIKIEEKIKGYNSLIRIEARTFKSLSGGVGFPRLLWAGEKGNRNFLVMELLGPSLEELFSVCSQKLSLKTVLMVADQLLTRLEFLHSKGWIHRDLKPDNMSLGMDINCNKVYLFDFGLSSKYLDDKGQHIPFAKNRRLTGTPRYCSVNSQKGIEPSRRDDLEAMGYILLYFLRGKLPWQGLPTERVVKKEDRFRMVFEKKAATSSEALCKGHPPQFVQYLQYVRSLKFDETPDYRRLRALFKEMFEANGETYDFVFDWIPADRRGTTPETAANEIIGDAASPTE